MKKVILTLAILLTLSLSVSKAQKSSSASGSDYTTALGLRLGYPYGVTVKHFFSSQNALEGILGGWYGGFNITGLYEYHMPLSDVDGLKWYVGAGADFTSWHSRVFYDDYGGAAIGIDGVIGLDYKFDSAPINLSLDWKPSFYFSGVSGFIGGGGGLSVRYTF